MRNLRVFKTLGGFTAPPTTPSCFGDSLKNCLEEAIFFANHIFGFNWKAVLPYFMLPYIYCLRLSKANSFRRKKLNMHNKLVMLSLVQIK